MDIQLIITLSFIHLIALISPGPDLAIIIRLATLASRQVAIAAALGIAGAIAIHTLLSLTGLSLAIHNSSQLYALVQLIGASYLGWMGIGALKAAIAHRKQKTAEPPLQQHNEQYPKEQAASELAAIPVQSEQLSVFQGFRIGLLTNLLNPKALVFFITLFSTLVTPTVTVASKVAIGVIFFSLSFIWFGLVSLMLSTSNMQQRFRRMGPAIDLLTGTIFVIVAVTILYQLVFL